MVEKKIRKKKKELIMNIMKDEYMQEHQPTDAEIEAFYSLVLEPAEQRGDEFLNSLNLTRVAREWVEEVAPMLMDIAASSAAECLGDCEMNVLTALLAYMLEKANHIVESIEQLPRGND